MIAFFAYHPPLEKRCKDQNFARVIPGLETSFGAYRHNHDGTMAAPSKMRLDLLLVERNLVPSRERARALILAGRVLVNEQKLDKPGNSVPGDAAVRLLGDDHAVR